MATHVIQDQNLNVHYNGAPKSNVSKPQRKGGIIAGRKALKDISNMGKPSALQVSKKSEAKNLSVAEENLPKDMEYFWKTEGFLHNHEECIRLQRKRYTAGLDMSPVHSASPWVLPVSRNSSPDTPNLGEMEYIEMEEIEMFYEIPRSPEPDMHWRMDMDMGMDMDIPSPDFELIPSGEMANRVLT